MSFEVTIYTYESAETVILTRLNSDWYEVDRRKRNSKARGKDLNRENGLKKLGDLQFHVAEGSTEQVKLFEALVEQKSAWFREKIIPDMFTKPKTGRFYRDLALREKNENGIWPLITGLSLDGQWIALNMGIVHRDHYAGLLLSTGSGDFKKYSPGGLLVAKTMQYCAEAGIKIFNFGAGANDLKHRGADISEHLVLSTMPVTLRGKAYEMFLQHQYALKDWTKSKPLLLNWLQGFVTMFQPVASDMPIEGDKDLAIDRSTDGNRLSYRVGSTADT